MEWLKAWFRTWLGVTVTEQLIAGQRSDHDQLVAARNADVAALAQFQSALDQRTLQPLVQQLNVVTNACGSHEMRLLAYESNVPTIRKVKAALIAKEQREAKKAARVKTAADALAAAPIPPASPEGVQSKFELTEFPLPVIEMAVDASTE